MTELGQQAAGEDGFKSEVQRPEIRLLDRLGLDKPAVLKLLNDVDRLISSEEPLALPDLEKELAGREDFALATCYAFLGRKEEEAYKKLIDRGVDRFSGCEWQGLLFFVSLIPGCQNKIMNLARSIAKSMAEKRVEKAAKKLVKTCGRLEAIGNPRQALVDELEYVVTRADDVRETRHFWRTPKLIFSSLIWDLRYFRTHPTSESIPVEERSIRILEPEKVRLLTVAMAFSPYSFDSERISYAAHGIFREVRKFLASHGRSCPGKRLEKEKVVDPMEWVVSLVASERIAGATKQLAHILEQIHDLLPESGPDFADRARGIAAEMILSYEQGELPETILQRVEW